MPDASLSLKLKKARYLLGRRLRARGMSLLKHVRRNGALPDLLIIGTMKAGTTTLFRMLCEHPGFVPPMAKEIQFFNNPINFARGTDWYRAHFPSAGRLRRVGETLGYRAITGEATPAMFIPMYAENAARVVPHARLVVTLRNPVDRAYSHYQHMRRYALPERNDFATAIERDLEWYRQGLELTPGNYRREASRLLSGSYVRRGHYAQQIEHWLRFFPRESFLFLDFDRWVGRPQDAANRVARFAGLPEHEFAPQRANAGGYSHPMPERCRELLTEHYRPHNRRLFELLGEDWGWPT